jgi:hypothetical protein
MFKRSKETLGGWEWRLRAGLPQSAHPERHESMPRTRKVAPPSKVSSPSMMQTMRMVNQSLSMPQQPNESSSAANAQHRVIKYSRKPPTTIADNTIDLRTNLIVHTPSGSGKIFPTSQVAKQHYQNNTIKNLFFFVGSTICIAGLVCSPLNCFTNRVATCIYA